MQRSAISPEARHRPRGGGAARPSSGRPRTARSVGTGRWCSDPLGKGVSATEPGAPRNVVGRPTPARGSGSRRRQGWRPPPDATAPEVRGRMDLLEWWRQVLRSSARCGGARPESDPRLGGSEKLPTTHLRADHGTAPVGTFSSQDPVGWPHLTSESYPVAPEGVIGRRRVKGADDDEDAVLVWASRLWLGGSSCRHRSRA